MRPFKFATITVPWTDSNGIYHPTKVSYSDAETMREHTTAEILEAEGMSTGDVTLIHVHGFEDPFEAQRYCKERGFIL